MKGTCSSSFAFVCACVCVSLTLVINIVYLHTSYLKNVGATAHQSHMNFIVWMNSLIFKICSKFAKDAEDGAGKEMESCYEDLLCTDLHKVLAALGELHG